MRDLHQQYNRYKKAFSGLGKPFAWVDMQALEQNARNTLKRAGGKPVRLATKSIRSAGLIRWILEYDRGFRRLMCYSATEALFLLDNQLDDIIIAYPITDVQLIEKVAQRIRAGAKVWFMADHDEHLKRLESIGKKLNFRIPIWVDVDMSTDFPLLHFGVYRSSIRDMRQLDQFLEKLVNCPHVILQGFMGYEAQISGVGDQVMGRGLQNTAIAFLKKVSSQKLRERRTAAVNLIRDKGVELLYVNGGGTGSIETTILEDHITEVTAGSAFFGPALYDDFRTFEQLAAAGFALEVTRMAQKNIVTCHGGGYIASGQAGKDKLPRPYLPVGCRLLSLEGAGEVQTPLRVVNNAVNKGANNGLKIGDPVFFRHAKAGEICEHFNDLHIINGEACTGKFQTYRGAGQTFL